MFIYVIRRLFSFHLILKKKKIYGETCINHTLKNGILYKLNFK